MTRTIRLVSRSKKRLTLLGATIVALAAGVVAFAYLSSFGSGTGQASAGNLNAPTNVTASSSAGSSTVSVSWTASSTSGSAVAPQGYYVTRIKDSDSSAAAACGSSPSSLIAVTSCSDLGVTDGTYHYTVTARYHTWTKTSASSNSVTVINDNTAPTASIAFPVSGGSYRASTYNAGCSPAGICGTASDSSGVASVRLSIKRNADGNYWNGSAFSGTSETFSAATLSAPNGTSTSWDYGFALPSDGSYTVHVQAADTVGNAQTGTTYADTAAFTIDTVAPTVAVTKVNGTTRTFPYSTNQNVISIGGTCGTAAGDGGSVSWSIDGQSGTAACSAGSWSSGTFTAITGEGAYTASASQTDSAGNSGSDSHTVTIDKTAPSVTLTKVNGSPVGFPYSTNATVTSIGGACGTATGDSGTVSWSVSGGSTQSGSVACSSGSWTASLTTALSVDGSYTLDATEGDAAGNTGDSGAKNVTVDKTAPSVTLTKVNGSAVTFPYSTNATVTSVGGSCGTASGDTATVNWSVSGGSTQSGSTSCVAGSWSVTLPTALSADSSYILDATQGDTAGNTGDSGNKTVTVDKTAPAVTLTKANGNAVSFPFTTNATVSSIGGACGATSGDAATVSWSVSGGSTQSGSASCSSGSWSANLTAALSSDGTYTVAATQTDAAGNTGSSGNKSITVDKTAPTTTLATTPSSPDGSNGWFKQSSVTFTLTATDATSGVASRFYTIDGGATQTYSGTVTISTQGDHTVQFWSTDNAGNVEATKSTHIKLDNVGPSNALALTNKIGGSFLSGSTVYYRGSAAGSFSIQNTVADSASGPASSTFATLGGTSTGWTHTTPDVQSAPAGGPYVSNTFSWANNTTSSPTEVVTGADAAGNTTAAPTLTFTPDTTAPSTTDNTSIIGSACKNTTQTVTLSPTDAGSGVAATYYTIDGSTPTTSSTQGTSIVLSSDGTYTIKYFSVDNVGNQESVKNGSTTICVDKTAPTITSMTLSNKNGQTAGKIESNETITIVYSEDLNTTTFCSTWTATGNQSLTGNNDVTVTVTDGGASNDTLTVTSASCTFHLGTINLGSTGYVSGGNLTFSGSSSNKSQITWTANTHTLVITLGGQGGAGSSGTVTSSIATLNPDSNVTDSANNALTSSFSTGNVKQF